MAWEIEKQHVDLAEMEHVTHFVERTVTTRNGEPARYLLQIRLGDQLQLNDKGELLDVEGNPYDHKAKQKEIIDNLNQLHARGRAFAQRHGHEIFKGGQQK